MANFRQSMRDMVAALAVLSLILLNFGGHFASAQDLAGVTAQNAAILHVCGDPGSSADLGHAPCHACRAGPAILPAPPSDVEPAYGEVAAVAYLCAPSVPSSARRHGELPPARAPPALA